MNSNASDNGNGNKIAVAHERVGLMKHLGTVSLAALLYISAEFNSLWAFKLIVICLSLSVLSSVIACIVYVANIQHRPPLDEKILLVSTVAVAILGLLVGVASFIFSILFI